MPQHKRGKFHLRKRRSLEDTLLNEEERAVLYELDQTFLQDVDEENQKPSGRCRGVLHTCEMIFSDKGVISLIASFFIMVIGAALLVLARQLRLPSWVDEVSRYVISAGIFGLASGGTNWIAIVMLFYKIPLLVGSGVFYRRHKQVRDVIKLIVLHMLFDTQHLENYLLTKIRQFSSNVQVVDNIQQALNSPETEKIIEERLEALYSLPEAHYLEVLGLRKEQLRPIIKPSVISLCAESAPMVLDTVLEGKRDQGISVPRFREEMDRYLSWRIEELIEKKIGTLMRRLMYRHLGWLVVWGCVFGVLIGVVTQGVKISLNFRFIL